LRLFLGELERLARPLCELIESVCHIFLSSAGADASNPGYQCFKDSR
jgi:hypothetical protein